MPNTLEAELWKHLVEGPCAQLNASPVELSPDIFRGEQGSMENLDCLECLQYPCPEWRGTDRRSSLRLTFRYFERVGGEAQVVRLPIRSAHNAETQRAET